MTGVLRNWTDILIVKLIYFLYQLQELTIFPYLKNHYMNRFIISFLNSQTNASSYQKKFSTFDKIKSLAIKLSFISLGLALFIGLVYLTVFVFIMLLCVVGGLFAFFFIKDRFFNKRIRRRNNKYSSDYRYGKYKGYDRAYKVNYKPFDDDVVN